MGNSMKTFAGHKGDLQEVSLQNSDQKITWLLKIMLKDLRIVMFN